MKKHQSVVLLCLLVILLLSGCTINMVDMSHLGIKRPDELSLSSLEEVATPDIQSVPAKKVPVRTDREDIQVGLILSTGGKGDKSFNDGAVRGLDLATQKWGIQYEYDHSDDERFNRDIVDRFIAADKDIIIAVGFLQADVIFEAALEHPDKKFAIIDHIYEENIPPNVLCVSFMDADGSFLAGVLAAAVTKSNIVGFVGGMESQMIQKFEAGFVHGVKSNNLNCEVLIDYVSDKPDGFANPEVGYTIATGFARLGADIIYHASGGSGLGVLEAAKDEGVFAIGVDANQNWMAPGVVLASMIKQIDVAAYSVVQSIVDNTFSGGVVEYMGLAEGGVNLTDLDNLTIEETDGMSQGDIEIIKEMKDNIPAEAKEAVASFKEQIIGGRITPHMVPDSIKAP